MIYELLESSPKTLAFETHERAQRGRGVLYATTPFVVYLALMAFLFFLATRDLSLWSRVKQTAGVGAAVCAVLSAFCFALGFRVRERIEASKDQLRITHRPAAGPERARELNRSNLSGLALDPSLRSLGADVLLVAVTREGTRVPVAEGEPHSGQIQDLARRMSEVMGLEIEPPKFTQAENLH
jgi:hypothetical protein